MLLLLPRLLKRIANFYSTTDPLLMNSELLKRNLDGAGRMNYGILPYMICWSIGNILATRQVVIEADLWARWVS